MTAKRWHQLAPLTGALFFVLVLAAFIVGGETPDVGDSTTKIRDYYSDSGKQIASVVLITYGAVALVFFAGILRSVLRTAEEASERLATVAFGGALLFAAGILSFAGFTITLAEASDKRQFSDQALQALNALNSDFFILLTGGLAVFLIATGIAAIRFAGLPKWLGWTALILGIAALTPGGFFAFLLAGIWTLVVSIWIYRNGTKPAAPAAA